jgi:N-acetylmuramoyl-L-alanine amidase
MKKAIFLLIVNLIAFIPLCVFAEDYVNIKYFENTPGIKVEYSLDKDSIEIKNKDSSAKVFLSYPYVVYGDSAERIDTPPFVEKGEIFITKLTYDAVIRALEKPQAMAKKPEATEVPTVKPEDTKVPTPVPEPKKSPEAVGKKIIEVEKELPVKSGMRILVLDPGHGGDDPGAIGPGGYYEKDAVLDIALRVREYLQRKSIKVIMTRSDDTFIPLKQRAVLANKKDADIFVSIHCNSSPNRKVRGTRSYIYSRTASSRAAAEAARFENKKVNAFEFLLNDLRKGAFEYLSIEAAGYVQQTLVRTLALKWEPTERAPFYVLANTNMPSILVETAFISNPAEEDRLQTSYFRDKVAKGIANGIVEYLSKIQ